MKNIVLWQAESNPQNKFYARSLFHWLHDGLRELRTAIVTQTTIILHDSGKKFNGNLWFAGQAAEQMGSRYHENDGGRPNGNTEIAEATEKLSVASPEPMLWFSKKRMELEMLHLEVNNIYVQCDGKNGVEAKSEAILQEIERRMSEIVMEVRLRMIEEGCAVNMLNIHKRMLM